MLKKSFVAALMVLGLVAGCPGVSHAVVTNTTTQTVTAAGNGVTTNYTISFDFRDNSQIAVTKINTSTGASTSVSYGAGATKFTITGGNPGTTVVMGTAPTTSEYLIISRALPLTQPVAFDNNQAFPASDLGTQLDLVTLKLQDLTAAITGSGGTSVLLSGGSSLPTAVANNFVGFTSGGGVSTFPGDTSINSGDTMRFNGTYWDNYALNQTNLMGLLNGAGGALLQPGQGGTGVANNGLLTWGTHALTFTLTADTSVTLPTSGTLIAGTTSTSATGGTIVIRDGSGGFSAGTIVATLTGNVTGNLTGNVTGNVSGTSANVTGTVAIGNGGTGKTTRQAAINALTGTQTSGYFLRSDGTDAVLAPLLIGDVPQGFSRLKLAQGTPNTVVINDASGNLYDLIGTNSGDVLTWNGLTWVSAAAGAFTVGNGIATCTDTGVANAYVCNPSPLPAGQTAGFAISFVAINANTGAATLNMGGFGVTAIKAPGGGVLVAGDILAGQLIELIFDGTNYQMTSQQGPAVSANTANRIVRRDSSGNFSAGTITANLTGNVTGNLTGNVTGNLTGTVTGHSSLDLALTGGTMSGAIAMGTSKITGLGDPTLAQDAATKTYVDSQLLQLNPADAVAAASTANIAGTYVNAVSGVCIGDTFTTTATTAFAVDGYTASVGDRILLKDQTSTFQSGVWTLTTNAVPAVSGAVFTRALDMDSSADLNAGQIIPVINGTTNAGSSWYQTAANTTCNTSAQTWTKFQNAASAYLLKANNLSDVTTKATSFDNLSPMSASGDIIYGGASGTGTRLPKGSNGQILTLAAGIPSWASAGAATLAVATKTSNYTLTSSDDVLLCNTTSGAFTLTLPASASTTVKAYYVKFISTASNILTIARTGADTIDGETSQTINTPMTGIILIPDGGTAWYVY